MSYYKINFYNYYSLMKRDIIISNERQSIRWNILIKSFRKSYEFLLLTVRIFQSRSMKRSDSSQKRSFRSFTVR